MIDKFKIDKLKEDLKQNVPKELKIILKKTNYEASAEIQNFFEIWGSKKNKDKRKFYISDLKRTNGMIDKLFNNDFIGTFTKILEKISNNENMYNPSISNYEYKDFLDYKGEDNSVKISKILFGSKEIISSDINSMYENTYFHCLAWSFNGKKNFKKYFNAKNNGKLESWMNPFIPDYVNLDKFDRFYREEIRGDKETVGLLTGLPISDVFADYILSGIDSEIREIEGYKNEFDFFHFKDNYTYVFYTNEKLIISKILMKIKEIFLDYKYSINWEYEGAKIEERFDAKLDWEKISNIMTEIGNKFKDYHYNPYTEEYEGGEIPFFDFVDLSKKEIKENSEKLLIDYKHAFSKNKNEYKKFEKSLYSESDLIKKGINDFISELLNNPKELLNEENFNYMFDLYSYMSSNEKTRLINYVQSFWDEGYQIEYLAWFVITNSFSSEDIHYKFNRSFYTNKFDLINGNEHFDDFKNVFIKTKKL